MFGLFEDKRRKAAQKARDEQRELERNARREIAELALAQNFSADEIMLIRTFQSAQSRAHCAAMRNVAGMSAAELALSHIEYARATDDFVRLSSQYYAMLRTKGGIEPPWLN